MKPKSSLVGKFANTRQNRSDFHITAHQKIASAKRQKKTVGFLVIDIDNFQSLNHHHGHVIGDKILSETHKRLASCLSTNDFISRIDGDEFAIILGNMKTRKSAKTAIHKLINCLNANYKLGDTTARLNASIGVVYYPHAGIDPQTLLQNATMCMQHAKSLGGNNCQEYSAKIKKIHAKEAYLENALKFALEKNELYVTYQPIFNLTNKKMVGMEALLRWEHPKEGMIPADIFIRLAEKNGLIASIGEWALQEVCKQAKQWYDEGFNQFKISLNVSSNQLLLKPFLQSMMRTFKKTKIPPHLLDIELTETAFLTHASYFEKVLKKIAKVGISVTIDDFGTGHSSLLRLKNLPVRALKIDKSFVFNITPHSFDAIIVNSLINLGKKLGLNIVAEGIETKADLQFLIDQGCPHGQGYYLCKPLNAEQMTIFLKKNK